MLCHKDTKNKGRKSRNNGANRQDWNKMDTVRKNATAVLPLGGDIKKRRMSRRFDSVTFHKVHGKVSWYVYHQANGKANHRSSGGSKVAQKANSWSGTTT